MTGTAGWPGLLPCTGGRPPGQARASSCRPRLARQQDGVGRRPADHGLDRGEGRSVATRPRAVHDGPRREAGLRVARFLGAAAVAAPSPSAAAVDALVAVRFFGAAGLALAVAVAPSSDPAVAAGLRVARFLGASSVPAEPAALADVLALDVVRRLGAVAVSSADVGAAVAATIDSGAGAAGAGLVASCARNWASSSGGTSLHSPDSRLGAGDRSPWSGRGPRLSGRGPRSYERSCGAVVRPLTSG